MDQPQNPQPPPLPEKQPELLHRGEPRKRNSSKVNLTISFVFHTIIIVGAAYFAARSGALGHKLKALTVVTEKKPEKEKEKEKPKENKPEPPKVQEVKAATAPPRTVVAAAAPPPESTAPAVAPAAVTIGDVDFNGGADVRAADPNDVYKSLVQDALRAKWRRPEDTPDDSYSVEVQLTVDSKGNLGNYQWIQGSGDKRWDDSVKAALAATKSINHSPPKGFPPTFTVKFDVDNVPVTSNPLEVSSR